MELDAKRAVVRVRLEKAHDDLRTAREMLKIQGWRDIERAKHSGVMSAFGEFLVKPGLIEPEYARIYADAREWREEQDYSDAAKSLGESTATQIVNDAERFVTRLERYLREARAIE